MPALEPRDSVRSRRQSTPEAVPAHEVPAPLRAIVAHSQRQYSHQTALGLQEGGMLQSYLTPVWYHPGRWPFSLIGLLPPGPRAAMLHELRKRSFEPLDPARVETYSVWKALPFVARKLDRRSSAFERHAFAIDCAFDRWVARRVRSADFDVFLGYEVSSRETFEACKMRGVRCVLDLAQVHWRVLRQIFEEERARGESFLVITPELMERIEAVKECELRLADFILTPSSYARQSLLDNGVPADRILLAPFGVDLSRFRPKESYGRGDCFTVLYVGSITPRKGLRHLLDAFAELKLPRAELVLIGGMADGETLLRGYEGSYRYVPYLHHEELVRHYQEADVFVLPSLLDSFGMVVVEAMACGTPVIVSDHTGAKDAVRDGVDGYVVSVKDPAALRDRIAFLCEHPEAVEEMGRNARKQAERYSWEAYRRTLREFLAAVVAR